MPLWVSTQDLTSYRKHLGARDAASVCKHSSPFLSHLFFLSFFLFKWNRFPARTAFEKLTDYDYRGTTYYSVRNLSLYECQGWCREEAECQAAAFSFVVNPLAPMQDTLCQLQNETAATNPAAQPQRAANMYYMTKLQIRSGEGTNSASTHLRNFVARDRSWLTPASKDSTLGGFKLLDIIEPPARLR